MIRTIENATHYLRCRHAIGCNGYTYFMHCHVLGPARKKDHVRVEVFGTRARADDPQRSRRRTVPAYRVTPIPTENTNARSDPFSTPEAGTGTGSTNDPFQGFPV